MGYAFYNEDEYVSTSVIALAFSEIEERVRRKKSFGEKVHYGDEKILEDQTKREYIQKIQEYINKEETKREEVKRKCFLKDLSKLEDYTFSGATHRQKEILAYRLQESLDYYKPAWLDRIICHISLDPFESYLQESWYNRCFKVFEEKLQYIINVLECGFTHREHKFYLLAEHDFIRFVGFKGNNIENLPFMTYKKFLKRELEKLSDTFKKKYLEPKEEPKDDPEIVHNTDEQQLQESEEQNTLDISSNELHSESMNLDQSEEVKT